ncbi:MAG: 3-deoxy-7-phosphoheptulonate synthase [Deltaproteobacteria bacterium]|nr:3-deoxy-7-phosphoheptulonate synthase [Deltaproteobacteria bacterium]
MDQKKIINTNIETSTLLPTPEEIGKALPASDKALETVLRGRKAIESILDGKDKRKFLVVGPCSIHDPKAALEYAEKLSTLAKKVEDRFFIAMRVYFEKPRTTVGWKGLINDPFMNDSFQIEEGIKLARRLLLQITEMGLATATEALDPIIPQYLSELVSWSAIGARTIESQTHREMASGLSMPVGFKNGTDGNIQVAINAMKSALSSHHFLGIDAKGRTSVFKTKGNRYTHVVLRGGKKPNYDRVSVKQCEQALEKEGLRKEIMVDCSHGNSNKDHRQQPVVFKNCLKQIGEGNSTIIGMMVESNLFEGNQPLPPDLKDLSQLQYGVSITDKCIDWKTTEEMILY